MLEEPLPKEAVLEEPLPEEPLLEPLPMEPVLEELPLEERCWPVPRTGCSRVVRQIVSLTGERIQP